MTFLKKYWYLLVFLAACVVLGIFIIRANQPPEERQVTYIMPERTGDVRVNTGRPTTPRVTALPQTQPTSEKDDSDDIAMHRAPEDDQPSDILTEIKVLALIEDLEKKRTELHETMEHKRKLSDLARDRGSKLDDKFYAMFNENLKERQALTEDFEHNELNGASLDETSRTATPEELEELASKPGARSLLDAISQEKAIGELWESESKALADKANALTEEYAAIYEQILAIDESIAELKAMLP